MATRHMATPRPVRLPVGFQVEPRSAARRRPMARPASESSVQDEPYEMPSLSSCLVNAVIGVLLLGCVVVFAVLVL